MDPFLPSQRMSLTHSRHPQEVLFAYLCALNWGWSELCTPAGYNERSAHLLVCANHQFFKQAYLRLLSPQGPRARTRTGFSLAVLLGDGYMNMHRNEVTWV